jgi:DNA-binding transcriptional LysR family regulator
MKRSNAQLGSRDLALVVSLADHGSLRRAAQDNGQTVAALSKQLRLLEERLGLPLFKRSAVGVQPTPAGQSLTEAGRRILADIDAALAAIQPVQSMSSSMAIGLGPFIAPFVARDLAPMARARQPTVQLELQVGYSEDLVAGVAEGRLDLAICHIEDVAVPPGLVHQVVQQVRPVCVVSARHPLLAQGARGRLAGHALAGLAVAGSRVPDRTLRWLEEMIGSVPAVGFLSRDYELVAEVLAGSDMFAMVPQAMADWMCSHHALAVLDVAMPPYVHRVHAIERAGAPLPRARQAIRDLLLSALARDETEAPSAQAST